jgi:transcriptional regulator with XRE-family HTH domain
MAAGKPRPRTRAVAPRAYAQMNRAVMGRLEDLREEKEWSANELMRRAGLSKGTIRAWRHSDCLPSLAALYAVARVLGCSIHDLIPEK